MRLAKKRFSEIIEQAKHCAAPAEIERGEILGGFAHNQVLAPLTHCGRGKTGAIRKFVVMAGCDGRPKSRNYYTEFAKALPKDAVILTAGCAKYKYNKLDLGDIGGIREFSMPDSATTPTPGCHRTEIKGSLRTG